MRKLVKCWLMAGLVVLCASGVEAAEIRLISAGAVRAVVEKLAESFAQETGHSVKGTFGPIGVVRKALAEQPADVVIATDVAIDELVTQQTVVGPRVDIARAGVGVGVRDGAPKPDISTPDAFKQAILAAKSIVYVDPALGATSGIHFAGVQKITIYAAGLAAKSTAQDPAKTFIAYLTRPASKEKFAGAGLDYK